MRKVKVKFFRKKMKEKKRQEIYKENFRSLISFSPFCLTFLSPAKENFIVHFYSSVFHDQIENLNVI